MSNHDRTPAEPSTPREGTRQAGCIVSRLRAEIAWEPEVGELMADAADEIERLRLTDAERKAIAAAVAYMRPVGNYDCVTFSTLRGLLERCAR